MQKILDKANNETIDLIIKSLTGNFKIIMSNIFGNYFCQKLFQCCMLEQRVEILKNVKTDFLEICSDKYGSHSLQSLVELINMPEEEDIIKDSITDIVIELSFVSLIS